MYFREGAVAGFRLAERESGNCLTPGIVSSVDPMHLSQSATFRDGMISSRLLTGPRENHSDYTPRYAL